VAVLLSVLQGRFQDAAHFGRADVVVTLEQSCTEVAFMIVALRCLFVAILVVMLIGTAWATAQENVFAGGDHILAYRWGVMTLFDAYFGFITFFVWVAYKESSNLARVGWFIAIMLLGNIAMASYMLIQLFRVPAGAGIVNVILRRADAEGSRNAKVVAS
jgi:hypothetical protein